MPSGSREISATIKHLKLGVAVGSSDPVIAAGECLLRLWFCGCATASTRHGEYLRIEHKMSPCNEHVDQMLANTDCKVDVQGSRLWL